MSKWSTNSEYREFAKGRILSSPDEDKNEELVKKVAIEMNVSKWTVYKILDGFISCVPDDIAHIVNATGDMAYIDWILNRIDPQIKSGTNGHTCNGDTRDEGFDIVTAVGNLSDALRRHYEDGKLNEHEISEQYRLIGKIRQAVNAYEQELHEIEKKERSKV